MTLRSARRALRSLAAKGDVHAITTLFQQGEKLHLPPQAYRHVAKIRKEVPKLRAKALAVMKYMEAKTKS